MKDTAVILDACCGSKMFWFDKENTDVIFADIRSEKHILCDGRTLSINPDMIMDFTALRFMDNKFKLVVFDPPHLKKPGAKSWMFKKYGGLDDNWRNIIRDGFSECWRVLAVEGVLIFKWSDVDIKVSEVLSIIDQKPLFGHRTMVNNRTIWLCFMKTKLNIDTPPTEKKG